jgi:hypothetical protein
LYDMGLLSRANGRRSGEESLAPETGSELDEMGKALMDRIRRLPPKKTTPYTALSLLKAYGSFQAGLCLNLRKESYTSYATIGLGVKKIIIPQEKIYSPETSGKAYMQFDSARDLSAMFEDEQLVFWCFPLDRDSPWGAVLLLGDNNNPNFNPEFLNTIIQGCLEIFNPQIDKILMRNSSGDGAADQYPVNASDPVEVAITQYCRIHSEFNGIILDIPAGTAEEDTEQFNKTVSGMVALFGTTVLLPSKRSLVLLARPMDKELIAHRLSKSLNTKALLVFEAGNPGEALSLIRSYV